MTTANHARRSRYRRWLTCLLICLAAAASIGWSGRVTRHVAWQAVNFFPADLARQIRRHHRRFDAGLERGLRVPPAWRAGPPGHLADALQRQAEHCTEALLRPVPLEELVEELGVLAVYALDANDPLAVAHGDRREPFYAASYLLYADSIRHRIRLVYYGQSRDLIYGRRLDTAIKLAFERTRKLYPFVGDEFYRGGSMRDWRGFDDKSVAFGVAAICLSRGMTDVANLAAYVWHGGGGKVPEPSPTPEGQLDRTVTVVLGGGFPAERERQQRGRPAMPSGRIMLPPVD